MLVLVPAATGLNLVFDPRVGFALFGPHLLLVHLPVAGLSLVFDPSLAAILHIPHLKLSHFPQSFSSFGNGCNFLPTFLQADNSMLNLKWSPTFPKQGRHNERDRNGLKTMVNEYCCCSLQGNQWAQLTTTMQWGQCSTFGGGAKPAGGWRPPKSASCFSDLA